MDIEKAMKNIESVLNKSNEGQGKKPVAGRPESQQNGKAALGQKKQGNSKQQQQNQNNGEPLPPHMQLGKDIKDIKSHEWYQMYGDISVKLESQLEENKKIQEDLQRRQDRYQKRELEYRKHIEDFYHILTNNSETLQLDVYHRISLFYDLQRELRVRYGYETDAYKKNQRIIDALKGQLDENIDGIQPKTKKLKEEQEKDIYQIFTIYLHECYIAITCLQVLNNTQNIVRKFNSELSKMKKKIEERKTQKGDQAADLKDSIISLQICPPPKFDSSKHTQQATTTENELHHHLELITNIAQRIDNENRALMKKNQELKGEYRTQENDRELLVKQLVMQKKENAKIREEIEFYDRIIEEKRDEQGLNYIQYSMSLIVGIY